MALSLKTRGVEELELVRARARRQLSYKRIKPRDCEFIVSRLDELEAYIINMEEEGNDLRI